MPEIHRTSDGFWTEMAGGAGTNVGGYDQPFHSWETMLGKTAAGSKVRLKPGSTSWTGKLGKRRRFDAPLGAAKIGI